MYSGKYAKKSNKSRKHLRKNKSSLLLITLVVLLGVLVGSTVAYLVTNTGSIANSFIPAKITTDITEDFDGSVKNNVQVKNTGDVEAFIRATVVVTWQNDEGEIYPNAPVESTDYTVSWTMNGWLKHTDGYYYYTTSVAPGDTTGVLLTSCQPVSNQAPEGYHLSVEILASAIQSKPEEAVQTSWGVTIANGTVTAYTAGGNEQ